MWTYSSTLCILKRIVLLGDWRNAEVAHDTNHSVYDMRKLFIFMQCLIMSIAISLFTGCSGDEDAVPSGGSVDYNKEEGIYLGIIGFNTELFVKDISLLNKSTASSFTTFINGLKAGQGTGLYYADYTALKELKAFAAPPKLKNVALVTFTDGLDNVSTGDLIHDPQRYGSTSKYRDALHNMIVNERLHGLSVSAYTIGVKGNDVTDDALFMENLRTLASSDNNVFQVSDMNEAVKRFQKIAASLYSVSSFTSLGVDVPGGYDEGQRLRFVFDNAPAASSSLYIEAVYHRTSNGRTLKDITYYGFAQGETSINSSSSSGAYYHFLFPDLKDTNGKSVAQSVLKKVTLWKVTSNGGWDKESEFNPASSSETIEDKSSAMIVLVLDCTTSLGTSDFKKMQQAGKSFVNTLVNPGTISDDDDTNTSGYGNGGSGSLGGHDYVDLGLPSGTLWGTCNVGATSPEGYGNYYAWGETKTKSDYSSDNYTYSSNPSELPTSADVAYVNWGSGWRMPSLAQFEELINSSYTTTTWTTLNGVNGRKITSKTNGNSIFLPAAGYRYGSLLIVEGAGGSYWSRTLYPSGLMSNACNLILNSSGIYKNGNCPRLDGLSVRPVRNLE